MKKRYLIKRYGLPAIILLFLLIWLGQQNAADNNILSTITVEERLAAYDPHPRLADASQSLGEDRNPRDFHKTKQHPEHSSEYSVWLRNTNRSNTSADLQIISNVKKNDQSKPQYEDRSGNFAAGALNKDFRRSPVTDNVIDLDRQRGVDVAVRNSDSTMKQWFRSSTDANIVDDPKAHVSVHTTADYHWKRPVQQPVFNDDATNSQAEPHSVPRANDHDQSFNVKPVFPSLRPLTPLQQVSSDNDDDNAGSLILARQLAARNFVKTDEKHSHVDQSADNNVGSKVSDPLPVVKSNQQDRYKQHLFQNVVAKSPVDRGRDQEIDELRKFAEGPVLPDYDLPMLTKSPEGRSTTPAAVLPELAGSSISTMSPLVINKTADEDVGVRQADDEVLADTDDVMSSAVVLGDVHPNRNYAVFSTTTENRDALNFVFLLPLTALAWKRVGFDSIVIIVGPVDVWNSDELYHFVLSAVRQLDAIVVFLEPRTEKSVMISQVSRIFIGNILRARAAVTNRQRPDLIDDTYLLTSDADIWPIYGAMYRLPAGRDILSLNSECCGAFSHRNVAYRMLPMANVGMRIGTWRRLTRRFGESPRSVDDILTAVVREFGPVALRPVHKGDNVGWFLDQMMVSLLVAEWTKRHGSGRIKLVPRDVGVDRLDRNAWGPGDSIADKIDAHLLGNAYLPGVWAQIMPLVRHLYGFETDRYNWCVDYYSSFQKLFVAKYRSQGGVGDS